MGMFDWLNTKDELDRKATPAPQRPSLGEPVLKLLKSLKEDEWVCELDDESSYIWKSVHQKDNPQVKFQLMKYKGPYAHNNVEKLVGYEWMNPVECAAVYNAVTDVFNDNYSKQVNAEKERQRQAFADKLDGVVVEEGPTVGEPVLSLLKAMDNTDDWRLKIAHQIDKMQNQSLMKVTLQHKTHEIVKIDVNYWQPDNDCGKPLYYSLSSTEDGFTPYERSVVSEKINNLIHQQQKAEKDARFASGRNRFNVLVNNEENV